MDVQKAKKKKSKSGQRRGKRIWYVVIVILTVAIGCYFLLKTGLLDFQSVDERLAAIEAALAIPDEENAAVIYYQLLQDEPLKDQQDIISTLLQASKKEKCLFPIITDLHQMKDRVDRISAMRRWARLLVTVANNDIAEGRIDAGIQKYHCLIQMANHLCQQPVLLDYLVGIASEGLALRSMKTIILEDDVSEKHLKNIEAAIPQAKDNWAEVSPKIMEFESLFERKNFSIFDRIRNWRLWRQSGSMQDTFDHIHTIYLRQLANRRGNRILIALRRYRNKSGRWPQTLDGIKDLVPDQILVDPINGGSFVYKLTEENFNFYSKGRNNIDEDGERNQSGADDWRIWPPPKRKTKNEKADDRQSNTQKDGVK